MLKLVKNFIYLRWEKAAKMIISIDDNIRLELIAQHHAQPLFTAINNSRQHLATFLPWVHKMNTVQDFSNYISHCIRLYQQQHEVSFAIVADDVPVGRIGLHHLNSQNKTGSIGYWLSQNAEGKGIVLQSCKKLITYGFEQVGLHRIEIKTATNNVRSQAIPVKLNFKKEGLLREAELVNSEFLDLYLYAMLSQEWKSLEL